MSAPQLHVSLADKRQQEESAVTKDALKIIAQSIRQVLPDAAVERALRSRTFTRPVTLIAIGKAAWRMANTARAVLGDQVKGGIVITKYGHCEGPIDKLELCEAGHPVPDQNSVKAASRALSIAADLTSDDEAVLLISGGGSALFECPVPGVTLDDIAEATRQMLARGANINEMNCVRKRLSAVKGGRLAQAVAPAHVFSIILSDVLGDSLDTVASGPACPDLSTCADAQDIVHRYNLRLRPEALAALAWETPKHLNNVENHIAGNVDALCTAARDAAEALGYPAVLMDQALSCEASDAGHKLAEAARGASAPCALIWGGETVVHLKGHGLGGRNQELALSAAEGIAGLPGTCVFAVGSDGTDGPTDAAGGLVTGETCTKDALSAINAHLANNDSYPMLKALGGLIMTGPTGTNVNDLYVVLKKQ